MLGFTRWILNDNREKLQKSIYWLIFFLHRKFNNLENRCGTAIDKNEWKWEKKSLTRLWEIKSSKNPRITIFLLTSREDSIKSPHLTTSSFPSLPPSFSLSHSLHFPFSCSSFHFTWVSRGWSLLSSNFLFIPKESQSRAPPGNLAVGVPVGKTGMQRRRETEGRKRNENKNSERSAPILFRESWLHMRRYENCSPRILASFQLTGKN